MLPKETARGTGMKRAFYARLVAASCLLVGGTEASRCQVYTSSYHLNRPAPSALDTMGNLQQLELQRQQIEMQQLQLEQQRLQLQQSTDRELQRQLEFEKQQAELYRKRHSEPPQSKNKAKNPN